MIANVLFSFADVLDDINEKGLIGVLTSSLTKASKRFGDFSSAAKLAGSSLLKFAASPVGLTIIAMTAVMVSFSRAQKKLEELRKETEEAANSYEEASKSVDDYTKRYEDLQKALADAKGDEEETYNIKKQLLELQNEINDSFGTEYDRINLVTQAYKDQTNVIREYNKVKANEYLSENAEGIEIAKAEMERETTYSLGTVNKFGEGVGQKELRELVSKYSNQGVKLVPGAGNTETIIIEADPSSAYETINAFMLDIRELGNKYKDEFKSDDDNIFNAMVGKNSDLSFALENTKAILDDFKNIYKQGLLAEIALDDNKSATMLKAEEAINAYNESVLKAEDPFTDEDVAVARQNMEKIKQEMSGEDWIDYSYIVDSLFEGVDTKIYDFVSKLSDNAYLKSLANSLSGMDAVDLESMVGGETDAFDKLLEWSQLEVQELIDLLIELGYVKGEVFSTKTEDSTVSYSDMGSKLQDMSSGLSSLMDIYEDVYNKGTFDWSSIFNNTDFQAQFGNMTNVTEEYKNAYDDFIKTVGNSPKDIKACQQAFNNLATAYIQNKGVLKDLTEETRLLTIYELEHMGVANAEEVVTTQLAAEKLALANQEAALAIVKDGVTDTTADQINALVGEGAAAEFAKTKLFQLILQERVFSNDELNTSQKIEEIENLAKAFNQTAVEAIIASEMAKTVEDPTYTVENALNKIAETVNNLPTTVNVNFDPYISGAKKAADATDELTEAMEKQKKALEKEKDALEKQKEHYEEVIDAINWFYDQHIEKVQDLIEELEEQNELLSEQQENYDMALSAIDRFYQNQIELIQEEQEAIDKRIEALQKENDERKKQYELEQKQLALERARNQKTALTYTADKGYVYMADETAIKDAENDLADAEFDNTISQLEKERESLQESIDKLEEYRELWGKVADEYQEGLEDIQMQQALGAEWESILLEGRIEAVTSFKDQYIAIQTQINDNQELIASYEEKIEYYEGLKEEWEKLTNKYQEETYTQLLIGEFGNNYEDELLNGRTQRWEDFATGYADIQKDLKDITDKIAGLEQKMKEYAASMEDSARRIKTAANDAANTNIPSGVSKSGATVTAWDNNVQVWSGKAKGGIIDEDDSGALDYFARAVGEDHMVALTEGEAVIPVDTVKANPELVGGLLNANGKSYTVAGDSFSRNGSTFTPVSIPSLSGFGLNGFNLNSVAPRFNNKINPGSYVNNIINGNGVNITIGDIHLSGVQDVNGLSNAIINKLPNTLIQALGRI